MINIFDKYMSNSYYFKQGYHYNLGCWAFLTSVQLIAVMILKLNMSL